MRDIEHKATQEEPAPTPEQKGISTTGRQKRPRAWRYIIIGATAVLVLALIFAGVLALANQRAKQSPVTGSTPTTGATTLPTSTPITSTIKAKTLPTPASTPIPAPALSEHNVNITTAGGIAYLSTSDTYTSTSNNEVIALRTSDGSPLWHQTIAGSAEQAPLVSNGVVYVTSYVGQNGPAYAYALRASDGSILWRYSNNNYNYLSLSTSNSNVVYVASQDGISALNNNNGATLWHFAANDTDYTAAQEVNGVVYFSSSSNNTSGTLYALRASDGSLAWKYATNGYTNTITVANGVVYIASGALTFAALRAADGHQLWKHSIDANMVQSLQLSNGVLYTTATKIVEPPAAHSTSPLQGAAGIGALLWSTLQNAPTVKTIPLKQGISSVYAIRASDGAILWHHTMNNGADSWAGWFSVVNGVVYASDMVPTSGTGAGDLFALQSSNGSELWHDKLNTAPYGASLDNGVIYLSSSGDVSGVVYAVHASDGSLLWNYPIAGSMYAAPVLEGEAIYAGANNGMAYALRAGNGKLLWHYFTDIKG